ncbi:MAG: TIGR01777 family oxidoreductase [Acidobacteriaceae bacterium]
MSSLREATTPVEMTGYFEIEPPSQLARRRFFGHSSSARVNLVAFSTPDSIQPKSAISRVLVSGASGLIGTTLIPSLTAAGYQVSRLVRGAGTNANDIQWDPTQPLSPDKVSGFDAVIHLAGESVVGRWSDSKKKKIRESRVLNTHNLAEAIAHASKPPRIFICASAIGYYGDRGDEIMREESPSGVGFLCEVCRDWEAACEPAIRACIHTVNIRIGLVLSSEGGTLRALLPNFRMGLGGRMGTGRQWWSWIDIEDIVGAIHHTLRQPPQRANPLAVNLVAPNPVTNADFTKILAKVLSRPALFTVPKFVLQMALGGAADELIFASQRVEPAQLINSGYVFKQPDLKGSLERILKQ